MVFGGGTPKLSVLTVNNMHTMEHYGNLVTYMRMKNSRASNQLAGVRATAEEIMCLWAGRWSAPPSS